MLLVLFPSSTAVLEMQSMTASISPVLGTHCKKEQEVISDVSILLMWAIIRVKSGPALAPVVSVA